MVQVERVVAGDRQPRHEQPIGRASSRARPPLCGGCAAGMKSTRSRPMASAASVASHRCPRCGGSKVPPRMPMRPRGASPRPRAPGCDAPLKASAQSRRPTRARPRRCGRSCRCRLPGGAARHRCPAARRAAGIGRATLRSSKSVRAAAVSMRRPRMRRSPPSATTCQPDVERIEAMNAHLARPGCASSRDGASSSAVASAARRASSPVPSCALTPIGIGQPAPQLRASARRTSGRSCLVTTSGIGRSISAGSW